MNFMLVQLYLVANEQESKIPDEIKNIYIFM